MSLLLLFAEKMYEILAVHFIINVISVAAHIFGLFILFTRVHPSQHFSENQRYLLFQLSLCELICLIIFIVSDSLAVLVRNYIADTTVITVFKLLNTILNLPCFLGLIITMLAITIDRFLSVYLNIRYPVVCTLKRVRIALRVVQTTFSDFRDSYLGPR